MSPTFKGRIGIDTNFQKFLISTKHENIWDIAHDQQMTTIDFEVFKGQGH